VRPDACCAATRSWLEECATKERQEESTGEHRCQRVRSVRDTFRQFGHRAGTVIRDKYGEEDGAAGGYRTYDLSLTKGAAEGKLCR
jgi:hypothetical protein